MERRRFRHMFRKAIFNIYERDTGINYLEFREKLKFIMDQGAWIIKNEKKLNESLNAVRKLKKEAISSIKLPEKTYRHLRAALETLNMIKVGEVLIIASLIRTESRGAHYREDYPEQDDNNWLKYIILYKENEELKHYTSNIEK